jgi:hypothetical protein
LGVLLVICGITVDVWPLFASDHVSDSNQFTWLWVSLLFFANIPMAASNVYKEKYLKEAVRVYSTHLTFLASGRLVHERVGCHLPIDLWFTIIPNHIYSTTRTSHVYQTFRTSTIYAQWMEMFRRY